MKKKIVLSLFIIVVIFLSGCGLFQGMLDTLLGKGKKTEPSPSPSPSPYKQPEVLCNYVHYFRTRNNNFSQWWYPGKEPSRILGPEPWRRDIWIGRAGDYPYIGPYDNVDDKEIMRWHIRLAKAAGITAFILAINNWDEERPQTERLLAAAYEENFKIGFMEANSYLGAVSRRIFDGRQQPTLPREYEGYDRIIERYYEKMGLPQPSERTRYLRPELRSLREVSPDALEQAGERISKMMNQGKAHPAYFRIDGKPIIVIPYMDAKLIPADFKALVGSIKAHVNEDLYVVAIVPSVYWYFFPPAVTKSGITAEWADTGTNAFTHWTPNGMITATQKTRLTATQFNVRDSLKWKKDPMIPVMPGSEDDVWNPGDTPAPTSPRNNGKAWSEQLDAALAAKPRFILIQAWNEWHEASQIEPSTFDSDPYLYVKILAQKLKRPWQPPPLPPRSSIDPLRIPFLPY